MKRKIKLIVSTIVFGAFIVAALACGTTQTSTEEVNSGRANIENSQIENLFFIPTTNENETL